ncbi:MAG TPA: 3-phosphoserine/phosphohydroxythreonine transaminase [Candidatus Stercoripulliclostridium merdipullorum]|uniref:Phosphoserine aminotransferase n=1 Tax=Candidatus Stercoripulliclostridium merdipullorum TaxID=2840952 RepID=A0A9D1SXB4_9FIRM|nr:3-phosphoserine/phosphohydroxythreonine transaminase [Candidatus Stercoripulliclostridium merdipullorum]
MQKVYNFSAGPSVLADEVKLQAQKDFLNFNGSGMSVTEMSHRSKWYEDINNEAGALLRELMGIGDDYYVLFVQGGASTQFEAVPLNLLVKGKADYLVTGNFAEKAAKEAQKYGDIRIAASSKDKAFTYIPDLDTVEFRDDIDYVHFTMNNTIFGTRFTKFPKTAAPLVTDMSSNILSEVVDVNRFQLIYAGAQKNIGPAGVTIVIVKKDAIDHPMAICPTMLKYSTQAAADSLYNTPPCFSVYMSMLTFRWLKKLGGVAEIQKINEYKAGLLYDFIDNSSFYTNRVNPADRSIMNVPFVTPSPETDAKFIKEAAANGLVSLKGHRLAGGMRASIYNAMPVEGVKALIDFMKKFETENR